MLYLSAALRFSLCWILLIERQLVYRLPCPIGRQSSAEIGQQGRLLINPTRASIHQQVLLYYCYNRCQEYESTRLDSEQYSKSNNKCHPIIFKDHDCVQGIWRKKTEELPTVVPRRWMSAGLSWRTEIIFLSRTEVYQQKSDMDDYPVCWERNILSATRTVFQPSTLLLIYTNIYQIIALVRVR